MMLRDPLGIGHGLVGLLLGDHEDQEHRNHQRENQLQDDKDFCKTAQGMPPENKT